MSLREKFLATVAVVLLGMLVVLLLTAIFRDGHEEVPTQADSPIPEERLRAINSLAGKPSEQGDGVLLVAMRDPDPRVAARAVRVVGRWTHRDNVPLLKRALRDSRAPVRAAAAAALGKFRLRDRVDAVVLTGLLDDARETPEVRAAAARSLGRMRIWAAMPSLINALEDPNPTVRGRAGAAVRRILGVDFGFRANASLADRARAVAEIRSCWRGFRQAHLAYLKRLEEQRR